MSYIDTNLLPGEQVLYRTKLHWIIFATPVILSLFAIIFLILPTFLTVAYLFIFVSIVQWSSSYITYVTSEFGITNKRVLIKVGFIRRQSIETLLQRVESIQVDQSIVGRLLGFGTITVCGVSGTKDRFFMIEDPMQFRRKVQEQLESTMTDGTGQRLGK